MAAPLGRRSGSKRSQVSKICFCLRTWNIMVVEKLGNTRRSRVVTSTSPWTYHQSLTFWKRIKPHLQSQKKNWKDHERGWLPLWVSRPKQDLKNTKSYGMPSEMSVRRTFWRLLRSLRKLRNYLLWEEKVQTWAYWQLLSSSKAACEVYDEIW